MLRRVKEFKEDESGSFTLEASLLFPAILIATMMLIFFSMIIFYKSVLQFEANRIADQVAYVWNNSSKDVETGEFVEYTTENGDGLYWRLTDNNFLQQFGLSGSDDSGLANKKKREHLAKEIPGLTEATVSYNNSLLNSTITVSLEKPMPLPSSVTTMFGTNLMEAKATRSVTEPVEVIRNTEVVVYFGGKIKEYYGYIEKFMKK
ncbi:TadE/TadG family type IV pilus assembly protein [Alkalicoccobacillus gibsonii]|uniref:Pilus assembly protein n=2 Tax=Alkalicoccobacillus gibsonii TaxID=79881 RepID=A0ABU9VE78_9BACI|nr:pilus assembly protein [Alkalicoccobacillus gibsonii]MBM0066638.1 pilus assembly protein [Alkalicoccobacillus gibsonii]